MSISASPFGGRVLAGATVLQLVPSLEEDTLSRAVLDVALALLRSGGRALVASGGGPLVGELQALGGEWMEFDFGGGSRFRRQRNQSALQALLESERVDIVHAHAMEPAHCAAGAVKGSQAALVTSYAGTPPPRSWRTPPEQAMAQGRIVIAPSEFAGDLIAARHAVPRERIVCIPPSVDTEWFDPRQVTHGRIERVRGAWRVGENDRVVLAPGRGTPAHAYATLIDSVRVLVNGGLRGTTFVIARDGEDGDAGTKAIDARVMAQGLGPVFRRAGRCPDMPAAYAAADLVALPDERGKIFNATAVEAQSMGRPVIAPDIDGLPEIVLPGESDKSGTGWLVRPDDAIDFARSLSAALGLDDREWLAMGVRARQEAEARFAPAQVAQATLAAYSALLDSA